MTHEMSCTRLPFSDRSTDKSAVKIGKPGLCVVGSPHVSHCLGPTYISSVGRYMTRNYPHGVDDVHYLLTVDRDFDLVSLSSITVLSSPLTLTVINADIH